MAIRHSVMASVEPDSYKLFYNVNKLVSSLLSHLEWRRIWILCSFVFMSIYIGENAITTAIMKGKNPGFWLFISFEFEGPSLRQFHIISGVICCINDCIIPICV